MVYDYVSEHSLAIDLSSGGDIKVLKDEFGAGGNFTINAPNSQVSLSALNFTSGIYVSDKIYLNATKNDGSYGIKLSAVNLLNPDKEVGSMYKDVYLDSDTIFTIEKGVTLNNIYSKGLASNIHIKNHGVINNIDLSTMRLIDDYLEDDLLATSYPQIIIDNYNEVKNSVYLPSWSYPYLNDVQMNGKHYAFVGNTKILIQWGASNIILTNNPSSFTQDNIIDYNQTNVFVEEVNGDSTNLIVYYKNKEDGASPDIEMLIKEYFEDTYFVYGQTLDEMMYLIQKLEVRCNENKILLES